MIPFMWILQSQQIHRDKKQISGCQGWEEGPWGGAMRGPQFLWGDENVLKLDSSDGRATF